MKNIACQLEHSVDAEVSPSFAWNWRTDIKNWDDPPAQFQLDGPFASGSWGTTLLPGQEPLRWQIRDVRLRQASPSRGILRNAYRPWNVNALVLLLMIGANTAFSQDAGRESRHELREAERTAVINAVVEKVNAYYVYPDVAQRMTKAI